MRGYEERWSDSRRYQSGLVADDFAIDVRSGQSRCLPAPNGQGKPKIACTGASVGTFIEAGRSTVVFDSQPLQAESDIRTDGESCAQERLASVVAEEAADDTLNVEELAAMLSRGEFPPNYDSIIRKISDEDLERLWALFRQSYGL